MRTAMIPTALARHWAWAALAASVAMLAAAHAFERFGGLYPCQLCLRQREVYWGAIAIAVAGLLALRLSPRPRLRQTLGVFLGLAFLTGAIVALYHVAVELGLTPPRCDGFAQAADLRPLGTGDVEIVAPRCEAPEWTMFGVSMAGYNAMASLVLAALSFLAAARTPVTWEMIGADDRKA